MLRVVRSLEEYAYNLVPRLRLMQVDVVRSGRSYLSHMQIGSQSCNQDGTRIGIYTPCAVHSHAYRDRYTILAYLEGISYRPS